MYSRNNQNVNCAVFSLHTITAFNPTSLLHNIVRWPCSQFLLLSWQYTEFLSYKLIFSHFSSISQLSSTWQGSIASICNNQTQLKSLSIITNSAEKLIPYLDDMIIIPRINYVILIKFDNLNRQGSRWLVIFYHFVSGSMSHY